MYSEKSRAEIARRIRSQQPCCRSCLVWRARRAAPGTLVPSGATLIRFVAIIGPDPNPTRARPFITGRDVGTPGNDRSGS